MNYLVAPERYEADGFVLRSFQPGDGPLLTEAVNASYEHLRPWMRWAVPQQALELSEKVVRQSRGRYLLGDDFVLGIFSEDETRLLGGCGFHLREGPLSTCSAELGMWVRASEAGRGLGTRAVLALLAWGFTEWPWLRLSWRCDVINVASSRVAEKAGMRLEGVLRSQPADVGNERRDSACYGLTKADWLSSAGRR